jgi:hypothetical protein
MVALQHQHVLKVVGKRATGRRTPTASSRYWKPNTHGHLPRVCEGQSAGRLAPIIAAFSAIMVVGAFVLPAIRVGMMEASTTGRALEALDLRVGSTRG